MTDQHADNLLPDGWQINPEVIALQPSVIREILKVASQPGVISFAGGLPAPELFPRDDLKKIAATVIEEYSPDCLQYTLSQGVMPIRTLLADRATARGTKTSAANILITTGSQQGIELIARAFLQPGDYVVTENPSYIGALQAFNAYGAKYAAIDMDEDGMLVDQVERCIIERRPKFIYSVSTFQNPTGITMTPERRQALCGIAAAHNIPLVDDSPYGAIRFAGKPVPSLKSCGGDSVIALRTFSKTMTPGLRIGWINGPRPFIALLERVKQFADLHSSSFTQYLVYEYVRQGLLESHIEQIKADYRMKRDLMLTTLEASFPKEITWTHPEGGLFLWLKLPLPLRVSAQTLFQKALDLKVAYVPGGAFFPNGGGENTLRLNFSNASPEMIVEGIHRLARLFKENI